MIIASIVAGFKALLVLVLIIALSAFHQFMINGFDRHTFWGEFGATVVYLLLCYTTVKTLW